MRTMRETIVGVILILIAHCACFAFGHDDLEGYCAAVLPAYETSAVGSEIQIIGCECEDSHSGKEQTIVVCTFIKDTALKTTGSCNAKFCLFTQNCEEPDNFNVLGLGITFDLSLFDGWCVEKYTDQTDINPTRNPSQSPEKEVYPDHNTTNSTAIMSSNPQTKETSSNARRIISPLTLSSFGKVVFVTTLILIGTIIL